MRLSASQYASLILALSGGGSEPSSTAARLLGFARKNRAMDKLASAIRIAERRIARGEGLVELTVETALEAGSAAREAIERAGRDRFPGRKHSFSYRVRPDLIGGVRISTEDAMLDATVSRRLHELERTMRRTSGVEPGM